MKSMSHFLKSTEGMFLAGVGLIIVILLGYWMMAAPASSTGTTSGGNVEVSATDHVRGAQAGKVTLVEFGDFQCPACGIYEPIVRQATADNKDTLKVVFRHFPLTQIHRNALLAAKASEAAALQGKFWEMHDTLYDKQEEWGEAISARDFFISYATTLKLDVNKFKVDIDNRAIEDKILAELKEGVNLGIQGTPTFFINGKKVDQNPQSLADFDKLIKDAAAASSAPTPIKAK